MDKRKRKILASVGVGLMCAGLTVLVGCTIGNPVSVALSAGIITMITGIVLCLYAIIWKC
jgi:uncharacterized membrane protein YjjP (DUF1212 family)